MFGFIRQKTLVVENKDIKAMECMLNRSWDLSGNGIHALTGIHPGFSRVLSLVFNRLNQTMTSILKTVVTLSSLGPELSGISGGFKQQSRIQNEKINEISKAGVRISEGIQEVSRHTQELTKDFSHIETDVFSALSKGNASMTGFSQIKCQVAILAETIQALKENSDSIHTIIDVINNISDETNILSLNALIEAVRGQADGNGFKVIAEEVGNLAKQSKAATHEIRDRLNLFGEKISRTVEAVELVETHVTTCEHEINGANEALNNVCAKFGRLSDNISDINEAAGGQAADVKQVSDHIMEIESAMGDQVRDAHVIYEVAEQVNQACEQMILDAGVFHLSSHHKARETAENMAIDPLLNTGTQQEREAALVRYLEQSLFIELAYMTDSRGRQVTANVYAQRLEGRQGLASGKGQDWSAKEWFTQPAQTRETFISKVYRSSATQMFCFTVAVPLTGSNGFSGVLGIDVNFRDMLDI